MKRLFSGRMSIVKTGVPLEVVIAQLEKYAPCILSEKWDNTGLLLEPQKPIDIKTILLTNDLTEPVVEEAIKLPAELIISYHPPIFQPLKRITTRTWKERVIGSCLENKIALYSPHTAWDSVQGGVNDWLSSPFAINNSSPILINDTLPNAGAGRLVNLQNTISVQEAAEKIKNLIGRPSVRVCLGLQSDLNLKRVKTLAICAGSGGSLLKNVIADLLITGEMSHHELLDAIQKNISVILCDHSNSERGFLSKFANILKSNIEVNVVVSQEDKDPISITI